MRYGALVDEDWQGQDPDGGGPTLAATSRFSKAPRTTS